VAPSGYAASGHGWYRLPGSGRSSFHFRVRKVAGTTNRCTGKLLLVNRGRWRVKGRLRKYLPSGAIGSTETEAGSASGTGALYWWNRELEAGSGGWQFARSVSFTISFDAGAGGKRGRAGRFGVQIGYHPVAPQPPRLPNSPLRSLRGGAIRISRRSAAS
jgi:hypothetical protein